MNKKIKIFVSCLVALFIGLISFIGVRSVNAYELNSDNNIVSSNLIDYKDINSSKFTDLGNDTFKLNWGGGVATITLPYNSFKQNTQYSFTLTSINGAKYWAYNLSWNYSDNTSENFTNNQGLDYGTYSFTSALNKTLSSITWTINFEADFSYLMFNEGQPLSYEPYGIWYNESYLNRQKLGVLSNLGYVEPYINNAGLDEYTIESLYNNGYITNDSSINLIKINNDVNTDYQPIEFYFYFDINVSSSDFNLTFSNSYSTINRFEIIGLNSNNNFVYYDVPIDTLPSYFRLSEYDSNLVSVSEFYIFFNSADQVCNINGNTDYYVGYNDGLKVANRWQSMYNELESSYNSLKEQYNDLSRQYNNYINGNVTLDTLIWNIATTPFETFKTIWDVDVLGVNLGSLCVGLMFVGIALYIWRKFI